MKRVLHEHTIYFNGFLSYLVQYFCSFGLAIFFLMIYNHDYLTDISSRSSHPEVFLGKVVLKICSKVTGEHQCRSAISIKLLCMGVLLSIYYIFSEHLFLKTLLGGCFCSLYETQRIFKLLMEQKRRQVRDLM